MDRFGVPIVSWERELTNGSTETRRNIDAHVYQSLAAATTSFERLATEYFRRPILNFRPGVDCIKELYVCRELNVVVWVYQKDSYDPLILDVMLRRIDATAR
jgi:hypothetical protein